MSFPSLSSTKRPGQGRRGRMNEQPVWDRAPWRAAIQGRAPRRKGAAGVAGSGSTSVQSAVLLEVEFHTCDVVENPARGTDVLSLLAEPEGSKGRRLTL